MILSNNRMVCTALRDDVRLFSVKTISRASQILRIVSEGNHSIADIARQSDLSKSTTHRLIKGLEESGLVTKDPLTRTYYLGQFMISLALNSIGSHQYLIHCAHDKMHQLQEICRETITLHIRIGTQRIRLHEYTGKQNVIYIGRLTKADPIWAGAMGKVLLSQLKDKELDIILEIIQLIPLTEKTIVDKSRLRKEVEGVRQKGYATSYGETLPEVCAISVPVDNYSAPLALSIIAPEYRFASQMMNYIDQLKSCAKQISRDLVKTKFAEF